MRVLYLPVEVAKRELDSKLLVAITALNNNYFDVVFSGRDIELFNRMTIPGVVLLKSAAGFELNKIKKLKEDGHLVFSLDEEGIIPPLNDPSINTRFSEDNLIKLDGLLSNGPLEIKSFPEGVRCFDSIKIVGNPRFDFYKREVRSFYDDNVKLIRHKHGLKKIILIASRFGDVNLHNGMSGYDLLKKMGYIDSNKAEKFFKGFFKHGESLFLKFLELPTFIAKNFPDYTIVVRPHPSEDHTKWLEHAKESNIVVTSDYDIASWLACSECLIHNGCTTAVEATAMQIPVISYMPVKSDEYDLNYSNEIGLIANNLEEVKNALNNLETWSFPSGERDIKTIIDYDLNENASHKIVKIISKATPVQKKINHKNYFYLIVFYAKNILVYILNCMGVKKDYSLRKYPFHSVKDYRSKLESIKNVFGFKSNLKVEKVGMDVIRIRKDER